jgi:preprotein translocase subunit YajC
LFKTKGKDAMRLFIATLTAAGIAIAAPAVAQAQAGIAPGMQVTDAAGGRVGTVSAINGDNLLIKTDKHEVMLPKASFTAAEGKLLIGMTQAQLDAEIEKNLAAASASVAAGATVQGITGTPVGKIDTLADGKATIALDGGKLIQVEQTALRGNADGTVTIGYTADQLQALLQTTGTPASAAAPQGQ